MTRRRLTSIIAFGVLVVILLGGSIYLRNFLLRQVSKRIQSYVSYSRLHLHVFPPAIVLEDIRTVSPSPFLSAKQIVVELPFDSIFKGDKPLVVFIDQPVVRISAGGQEAGNKGKSKASFTLPFALAKAMIRGGEFYYQGKKISYQAKGIMALLLQKGDSYSLQAEVKENSLFLEPNRKPLQGKISLLSESNRSQVMVKKFAFSGPEIIVKAKGSMTNLLNPQGKLRVSFKAEMDALSGILGIPFDWEGRTEGEGELTRVQREIDYKTSFSSDTLVLNKVSLEKVRGQVEFVPNQGVKLDMNILRRSAPSEYVRISYDSGKARGDLQGFHLDPILSYVSLPWPVLSAVWGNFTLDSSQLVADFEFKDESFVPLPGRYPFRGPVHFTWNREKEVTFSSPRLETIFGRFGLNGKVITDRSVEVSINGEVDDVKSAREFTSLVLRSQLDIPEIRGRGEAEVLISGDIYSPEVKIDFNLSSAGFDRFDASAAEGIVVLADKTVRGRFQLNDPTLKGEINLFSEEDNLNAQIHLTDSSVEKILTGLDLKLPLTGNASGDFDVDEKGENLQVSGTFSSPLMKFSGWELKEAAGKLSWDGDVFSFPELAFNLYGGRIDGSASIGFKSRGVEFDLTGQNVDLSLLTPGLAGQLSLNLKGKGVMGGEVASGNFIIKDLHYDFLQNMDAQGKVRLNLSEETLGINTTGNFLPGENDFSVEARFPLAGDELSVDVKGSFGNIELLLPWKGAKGKLNYLAEVHGSSSSPQVTGGVDFQGSVLPFPEFAQAITDYSGLVIIQNNKASIRSFKGKLGGGDVEGSGEITLGHGGVERLYFGIEGKNMVLSPFERTRALADASLTLIKDPSRFTLDGNILIHRLLWRREIYEKLAFSSSPYLQAQRGPSFLDDLNLNIHLKADDNAWMENSLGHIRGRLDLTITGNVRSPILLGDIEALGGIFYFQDRTFQVLRGRVSFFNPSSIEPYLDIKGETYVKDYRVTFTVTGLVTQLKPEFTSSPPLPPEDVLALLALGEAFKRSYSTEASTQLSTTSLLSFTLIEEAQKRAQTLFSLDRFRIDPFLMGSSTTEMTALLTVGKKISKDFFIYYSASLTKQTEEIIRLEWDLSNELSIVGTRNELGRLSFDVKIRRRF
jgi:hypothetical protein